MAPKNSGTPLLGRRAECAVLDDLVVSVADAHSSVLVLRGEAGIGKTALLEYAVERAAGFQVARVAGAESELELAFGGLHQLCLPFFDRLDDLPPPQREALGTAFGLSEGTPPDRFFVGLAVLNLLATVSEDAPVLCLVDDAQWLDRISAETLAFVARRLLAEPIAVVVGVRDVPSHAFTGLPELFVGGLGEIDARALLEAATPARFDERVRERIIAESRGNPLALLELPRGLTPAEIAGGFGRPDARPLASQIEQGFIRRIEALPAETRRLLALAAAEPLGDADLLWRAAHELGLGRDDAGPADAAGLIGFDPRVRFRHPLVRSAAYRTATSETHQEIHRALAGATDADTDPDRRAWHLARAATVPDEAVARELERSADRAHGRGGVAAAAAFLGRAVELTPDPVLRAGRALAAARFSQRAGAYDDALDLLQLADLGPLDQLERAEVQLLRGQIAFGSSSASAALPTLLAAARQLEPLDAARAREVYRDALYVGLTAGRLTDGPTLEEIAAAVLAAPRATDPGPEDRLLEGVALVITGDQSAGLGMLVAALAAYRTADLTTEDALGWLPLACRMGHDAFDFESWSLLSDRLVDMARDTGSLAVLPSALLLRLSNRVRAGDIAGADALAAEAMTIAAATGSRFLAEYCALVVESWRGRESATQAAIDAIVSEQALRGEGKVITATQWAAAVLHNGLGRYEEACAAAEKGRSHPQEGGLSIASLVELVEAAARSGRPERARQAVEELRMLTEPSGTDWALGTLSFARALVHPDEDADRLYRDAIERLERTEAGAHLARARLVYGEWLRRAGRRTEARQQLRTAYDLFHRFGAEAFADRALRELEATGETLGRRSVSTRNDLTPQETQIARLAASGLTNPEIGARLFLSPHTVDWHLRKVFTKLGVTSRRQLSDLLPPGDSGGGRPRPAQVAGRVRTATVGPVAGGSGLPGSEDSRGAV
jgi:DNA-binding CsgD family transcriptional regulator